MDKKEILARGRKEQINEYEEKILNASHKYGPIVIGGICLLFLLINAAYSDIKGLMKGIPSFDYVAILMSLMSYQNIYKFIKTKERTNLMAGMGFGLACIIFIYLYIINL